MTASVALVGSARLVCAGCRRGRHNGQQGRQARRLRSACAHQRYGCRRHRRRLLVSDPRPDAPARSRPELSAALCRAYNRWLAEYCKPYPDRLFGIAMLPLPSVELAIKELRYAVKEFGSRSFFMRPNPYNGRRIQDPA